MNNILPIPDSTEPQRMFTAKPASVWMADAAATPTPSKLWLDLWYEGEVACLFADTNAGKSIYAVQIAEHISQTQPVLYFDFEMSAKQFQMRYTDPDSGRLHPFNDNFLRVEFARGEGMAISLDALICQIEAQVDATDARVLIIDNITWLCNGIESGDAAGELMQQLIDLKRRRGLSILVLAHTPKRNISSPMTQNSLAGSKRLANFMDSMFAIGISRVDRPSGRYVKQIKVRSSELMYGDNNVITAQMTKLGSSLMIEHIGFSTEAEQLMAPDDVEAKSEIAEDIRQRLRSGQSRRQIIAELNVSPNTIARIRRQLEM